MTSPTTRARTTSVLCEGLESRTLLAVTPNDPLFASQAALRAARVNSAWNVSSGSAAVVVAHLDTGADYTHRDLSRNIWINQAEIPPAIKSKLHDTDRDGRITFYDLNHATNRPLMDDVNGNGEIDAGDLLMPLSQGGWEDSINGKSNANDSYVDDIIGWDFAENDNDPFDDAGWNDGHGTHTAGSIGARGNNGVGVAGTAWKTAMMILRIFDDDAYAASDARIVKAIRYSADSGARIANASWGRITGRKGDAIYNAIRYSSGKRQLFVVSAGNTGSNLDLHYSSQYPAQYDLPNILSVTALASSNRVAEFASSGARSVDIAAPGDDILSTLPGDTYGRLSGSSMATAMVSGVAALMLSRDRSLSVTELKGRLMKGADQTSALVGKVQAGLLNADNAVKGKSGKKLSSTSNTSLTSNSTSTLSQLIATNRLLF